MSDSSLLSIAEQAVALLKQAGADKADAVLFDSTDLNVRVRMGNTETLEQASSKGLGMRALIKGKEGFSQAMVSSSDLSEGTIANLAQDAVRMASIAPADPYTDIPATALPDNMPDLELWDGTAPSTAELLEDASACEAAALAHKDITNSEGAECSASHSEVVLATSEGFAGGYKNSAFSRSVSVIAGEGLAMETDYAYSVARHLHDVKQADSIGQEAAELAARRLQPKSAPTTGNVPVLFDRRVARSLIGNVVSAVNGASVARGTSFLQDSMGKQVASTALTISDNSHIVRGIASEPFDGEGTIAPPLTIMQQGELQSWLLDTRSANQLGLSSTGHASRGLSSPPSPSSSNITVQPGEQSVEALLQEMGEGLLLTDTFGMGVNLVTGDYSQGAAGFWVEKGEIAYPVNGITIASRLQDMLQTIIPASDMTSAHGINTPSLLIERMMVA